MLAPCWGFGSWFRNSSRGISGDVVSDEGVRESCWYILSRFSSTCDSNCLSSEEASSLPPKDATELGVQGGPRHRRVLLAASTSFESRASTALQIAFAVAPQMPNAQGGLGRCQRCTRTPRFSRPTYGKRLVSGSRTLVSSELWSLGARPPLAASRQVVGGVECCSSTSVLRPRFKPWRRPYSRSLCLQYRCRVRFDQVDFSPRSTSLQKVREQDALVRMRLLRAG